MRGSTAGLATLIATAIGAGIAGLGYAQDQGSRRVFMRQKLEYSKNVLEGISLEDFTLIARNARALKEMSEAAAWRNSVIPNAEEYLSHTLKFQRLADELKQNADERNLDGATLTYLQLTMTCVKCHNYVRHVTK